MCFFLRVRVAAEDEHSGVRKISFRFIVNGTLEEKAKKDFLIESKVLIFITMRDIFNPSQFHVSCLDNYPLIF